MCSFFINTLKHRNYRGYLRLIAYKLTDINLAHEFFCSATADLAECRLRGGVKDDSVYNGSDPNGDGCDSFLSVSILPRACPPLIFVSSNRFKPSLTMSY